MKFIELGVEVKTKQKYYLPIEDFTNLLRENLKSYLDPEEDIEARILEVLSDDYEMIDYLDGNFNFKHYAKFLKEKSDNVLSEVNYDKAFSGAIREVVELEDNEQLFDAGL